VAVYTESRTMYVNISCKLLILNKVAHVITSVR